MRLNQSKMYRGRAPVASGPAGAQPDKPDKIANHGLSTCRGAPGRVSAGLRIGRDTSEHLGQTGGVLEPADFAPALPIGASGAMTG
jgi:hypothetical protein